jgi:hypothetical protein
MEEIVGRGLERYGAMLQVASERKASAVPLVPTSVLKIEVMNLLADRRQNVWVLD